MTNVVAPSSEQCRVAHAAATTRSSGLAKIRLMHDLDNFASCRVAEKSGYAFAEISPAQPSLGYPAAHLHLAHPPGNDRR